MPNDPNNDGCAPAQPQAPLERVIALLSDALQIVDRCNLPGHIGARLQHVIDEIEPHAG